MTQLSPEQIYSAALAAGFSPDDAVVATAIALGESNGRIEAHGDQTLGHSYGLWQIHAPSHPQYDINELTTDPVYAAKAAFDVSGGGQTWQPWSVYKNGAYQKFLAAAQQARQAADDGAIDPATILSAVPRGGGLSGDDGGGAVLDYSSAVPASLTPKSAEGEKADPATGLVPSQAADPAVMAFLQSINQNPDAWVKAKFPAYALYLADPELGPILRSAATENWDDLRLQNAVHGTNWWKTHGAAVRNWDQIVAADPATAQQQRDARMLQITQQFQTIGYVPDQAALARIVEDSLRQGWDTSQLTAAVMAALPGTLGAVGPGDIQATVAQLRATASSYFMPLSDDQAFDWSKRIAAGTLSQNAAIQQMQAWGKAQYPWLAPQIDQGITVHDYFAPMQQSIATIMGQSPDSIDLMNDGYWGQITRTTDGNGLSRPPTLADAQRLARQSPNYATTTDAINRSTKFVMAARQIFEGA